MTANLRDINKFLKFTTNNEGVIEHLEKINAMNFFDEYGRVTSEFGPEGNLSFDTDGALSYQGNRIIADALNVGDIASDGSELTSNDPIIINGVSFENDTIAPAGNTLLFNAPQVQFDGELIDAQVGITTFIEPNIPNGTISFNGTVFQFRQEDEWVSLTSSGGSTSLGNFLFDGSKFGYTNGAVANYYAHGNIDIYSNTPTNPDFEQLTPTITFNQTGALLTNAQFSPENDGYTITSDGTVIKGESNALIFSIGGTEKINIGTTISINDLEFASNSITNTDGTIVLNANTLSVNADINLNDNSITNVPIPTSNGEVANKEYVDNFKDKLVSSTDNTIIDTSTGDAVLSGDMTRDNINVFYYIGDVASDPTYIQTGGSGIIYGSDFLIAVNDTSYIAHGNVTVRSCEDGQDLALELTGVTIGDSIYANGYTFQIFTPTTLTYTNVGGIQIGNNINVTANSLDMNNTQFANVAEPETLDNVATRRFAEDTERLSTRRQLSVSIAGDREQLITNNMENPLFWVFYYHLIFDLNILDEIASDTATSADIAGAQLTTIQGNVPDIVIFTAGRNDQNVSNIENFVNGLFSAGVHQVIFCTAWPNDNNTETDALTISGFNNSIINNTNVVTVNSGIVLEHADNNNYLMTGTYNGDDISVQGAFDYGEVLAEKMRKFENPLIPRAVLYSDRYDATLNPLGNAFENGVVPSTGQNWTVTSDITSTATNPPSNYIKKIYSQRVDINGTPASITDSIVVEYATTAFPATGDFDIEFIIQFIDIQNLCAPTVTLDDNGSLTELIADSAKNSDNFVPTDATIVYRTRNPVTINSANVSIQFEFTGVVGEEITGAIEVGFLGAFQV